MAPLPPPPAEALPPGSLRNGDLAQLACPECRSPLAPAGGPTAPLANLCCEGCRAIWPVADGWARLYRERAVQGTDRLMRRIYDALPGAHAPANRFLLPLLQFRSEGATRAGYLPRLELELLTEGPDGAPARILEVGIGDGLNLDLLRRGLPAGVPVEIWGVDLSRGMLERCRRRVREGGRDDVRLLMADAHALPFPDASFDRVFHVGAAGSYRDPRTALAEMARVARPGSPIVVVDEQLDPARRHGLYLRAAFKLLTFYDPDPRCPVDLLPPGATDVSEESISRFYYCLQFRMHSP
jgi:ubiquinone/menaquinone biosynthesis C-methylase UbiE